MKKNFIAEALGKSADTPKGKNPGALTRAVGGRPSQHLSAVRALSQGSGTPQQQHQAAFYINILAPGSRRRQGM